MMFGLKDSDIEYILNQIVKLPEIEKAFIFGSRAKGNYKVYSDIDIAIAGKNINFTTISSLKAKLEEEGPLPYFIDVVDYTHLENKDLKEHIDRVGKILYEKKRVSQK